MHTRMDYLNGECTHREYYAQFVNDTIIELVSESIGLPAILRSTDEHFNDIPLERWDAAGLGLWTQEVPQALRQAGELYTPAVSVCILKEAARQIKEQAEEAS